MTAQIAAELAPTGTLRAAINLANFLLVTGKASNGDPVGVAPDMAAEIARRLGLGVSYVTYKSPGDLADDAEAGRWDIALIGAEPQRAEKIAFSAAYVEIEATYLVPAGSALRAISDVDKPGVRFSVMGRAAYGLWLERNIRQAEMVRTDSIDGSYDAFVSGKLDALAGLKPRLLEDVAKLPGARLLDGNFMTVQQAIGTQRPKVAAAAWLRGFVEEAKATGLVQRLIDKHHVRGLSVAS